MVSLLFLVGSLFFTCVLSGDVEDAAKYLERYGYYQPNAYDGSGDMENAIKEFQQFFHLNVSGVLDVATLELIKKPRCGYPDVVRRFGYYNTRGKWRSNRVTFRFTNYGDERELSKYKKIRAVRRALALWAGAAPLTFSEEKNRRANINIGWHNGYHGDGNRDFGRRGGVLAHAYFPLNGDTHFDEAEVWSFEDCSRGTDMLELATHELGHALGLDHSNIRGTIMFPTYFRCRPGLQLHRDDAAGIQRLYGSGKGTVVGGEDGNGGGGPTTGAPPPPPPPDGCENTDNRCDFWAYNGYCKRANVVEEEHGRTMERKCCLACKTKADCPNRNERCEEWAGRGECQKNPKYMHDFCRKACQRCRM